MYLDQICRENKNTFYAQKLFIENRAVYEVMWKNMLQPNRTKMPI